jgi:hypothetical protein
MQNILIIMALLLHGIAANNPAATAVHPADTARTPAERIGDSARIMLDGTPGKVFPLFGAYEEKRWTTHWFPEPIYPGEEKIEENAVFITPGHIPGEDPYTWVVVDYDTLHLAIRYLVTAPGRCWIIYVHCRRENENRTSAVITNLFTGWTETAIRLNRHYLDRIFTRRLKDWEDDINTYLKR